MSADRKAVIPHHGGAAAVSYTKHSTYVQITCVRTDLEGAPLVQWSIPLSVWEWATHPALPHSHPVLPSDHPDPAMAKGIDAMVAAARENAAYEAGESNEWADVVNAFDTVLGMDISQLAGPVELCRHLRLRMTS